ncbi:MAG: lactonase family protein [Phycisphaerae bacterium]|jgi:6-phosphogluconolactonase|nr:lactonase family protein [Phycisphaerae bacterium]
MTATTTRRTAMILAAMTICLTVCPLAQCVEKTIRVYLGTYTRKGSKGVYLSKLNLKFGTLSKPILAAATDNPTFLAIHPTGKFLYAAGGATRIDGKSTGLVTAFAMDKTTGKLTQLNRQPSGGRGPCHVVLDATGRYALAANYSSGSVASLPIGADGKLRPSASVVQHTGSSVNKRRQNGPHAHSINLDPANRFAVAADLGADKVFVYQFDSKNGTLKPHAPPAVKLAPGAGPRHFAFHPNGQFAYVINELDSTVTAFAFDAKKGTLAKLSTVSTLPSDFKGSNTTAEVQVHPSGKFLYGSNRGHDSIAIFTIDAKSGKLTGAGHQPTGGKTPRNFGIDPTGRFILAANQNSNNVVVFRVDQSGGKLKPTGSSITVSSPVCVKFYSP